MATKTDFKFVKLINFNPAYVARASTVLALYPKEAETENWDIVFKLILDRWRSRAQALVNLGGIRPKKYASLVNCRPSVFWVSPSPKDIAVRYCDRDDICPWCYMRRVAESYKTAVKALVEVKGGKLVQLRRTDYVRMDAVLLVHTLAAAQGETRALVAANQAGTDGPGDAVGMFWSVSAMPSIARNDKNLFGCWRVSCRILMLLPEGGEWFPGGRKLPPPKKMEKYGNWTVHARAAIDDQLRKDLASYFRYPTGLLRGDPKRAAEVIAAREHLAKKASKRVYLNGATGVFRKKFVQAVDVEEIEEPAIAEGGAV